jgi:hypothetical protein
MICTRVSKLAFGANEVPSFGDWDTIWQVNGSPEFSTVGVAVGTVGLKSR